MTGTWILSIVAVTFSHGFPSASRFLLTPSPVFRIIFATAGFSNDYIMKNLKRQDYLFPARGFVILRGYCFQACR